MARYAILTLVACSLLCTAACTYHTDVHQPEPAPQPSPVVEDPAPQPSKTVIIEEETTTEIKKEGTVID